MSITKLCIYFAEYKMIFPNELIGDFYPLAKSKNNKRVFRSPLMVTSDTIDSGKQLSFLLFMMKDKKDIQQTIYDTHERRKKENPFRKGS